MRAKDLLLQQQFPNIFPEDQWARWPEPIVKALADGADWQLRHEAKERKDGAHWYPTANPDDARRTGHFVNTVAHATLPRVEDTPYACTVRHEDEETLYALLWLLRVRARKELEYRAGE